jgi:hypothetical protein
MTIQEQIVEAINGDKTLSKHILKRTWTSGSCTEVYPTMLDKDCVSVQIDTRKNLFVKCITRIINNYPHLFSKGLFAKYDGSCPAEIRLYYANGVSEKLLEESH